MALKTILNKQTDFTGEFPEEWAKGSNHQQLERHQCVLIRKPSGELLPHEHCEPILRAELSEGDQ